MGAYDAFVARHGKPEPSTASSLVFGLKETPRLDWQDFCAAAGPGVYMDGFLHIGTPELPEIADALSAWSFVVDPDPSRQVVARNAHGDLVLLTLGPPENFGSRPGRCRVLSPRRTALESPGPRDDLHGVIRFYLVSADRIPGRPKVHPFLDDAIYREYRAAGGQRLDGEQGLLPIMPYTLGGKHELANFHVEPCGRWFREMGAAVARGLARAGAG